MGVRSQSYERNQILEIEWSSGRKKRVREVVRRSNARVTGKYPSIKDEEVKQWESPLELNQMYRLDADPDVISYFEQPVILRYVLDGCVHKHIPDLVVKRSTGLIFQEIKTDEDAMNSDIKLRSNFMANHLPLLGYSYEVIVESEIFEEPYLTNIKYLLRHGRLYRSFLFGGGKIVKSIEEAGYVLWKDICSGEFGDTGKNTICGLILDGRLTFDKYELLSDETKIMVNS